MFPSPRKSEPEVHSVRNEGHVASRSGSRGVGACLETTERTRGTMARAESRWSDEEMR